MDWNSWLQGAGDTLLKGGINYHQNRQQLQAAQAQNLSALLALQANQMQAQNEYGQRYTEGQPVNIGGGSGLLLLGAAALLILMVKN